MKQIYSQGKYILLGLAMVAFWGFQTSESTFYPRLVAAAMERTLCKVQYDPSYFSIGYPGGDIPADKGVCTDVVIRSYRKLGIDLQKIIHEDMVKHFDQYPKNWGMKRPDKNIDHRRIPNLMHYFQSQNAAKPISDKPADYSPGDIVCWNLGGGITHIGILVGQKSPSGTPMAVHNIGRGPEMADCLFSYTIIGHYRWGESFEANQ